MSHSLRVARGDVPRLREFATDWGRRFLPPDFDTDAVDVLVVIAHASTHHLPIHLIRPGGRDEILGGLVAITYCSSSSMFCRCQARNLARTVDPRAWTFGDQSGPSGAPLALDVSAGGCDVLKGNDDAFNAICRKLSDLFPGEHKLLGNASHPYNRTAAKAPFRSRARTDAMLVMAHGYIDRYQHEFSGLLVASDPMGIALRPIPVYGTRYFDFRDLPLRRFPPEIHTTTKADLLTAAELEIDAPLETQLVVLLACSAGWGRMRDGDEPASIAEKFLHIGAPTVVAPLWESDIDAAYAWTDAFLTGWLRQGQPKALAARDAYRKTKSAFQDQPQKFGVMALKGDWL